MEIVIIFSIVCMILALTSFIMLLFCLVFDEKDELGGVKLKPDPNFTLKFSTFTIIFVVVGWILIFTLR